MKNIFLLIIISFAVSLSAQQAPSRNTQHQVQAQANELSLYKENIDDKIEAQDKLIAEASKRLGDQQENVNSTVSILTWIATILTLFVAIIGLYTGFTVKSMSDKVKKVEDEYEKLRCHISNKLATLDDEVEKAKNKLENKTNEEISKYSAHVAAKQKEADEHLSKIEFTTQKADELLTGLKDKLARGEEPSPEEKDALEEKVEKIEGESAEDWFFKGLLAQTNKDYKKANKHYEQAIIINPNYVEAYINWGVNLNELKDPKSAIDKYKIAIKLDPKDPDILNNWGCALNNLNQTGEAIKKFEQAINLQSDYSTAYSNWGYTLNILGKYQEAVEKSQKAVKLEPSFPNAHKNLGNSYLGLGEYENAIASYSNAIELKPNYTEAYLNWNEALNKLKEQNAPNYPTLVNNFKKILEANKDEQELKDNEDFQALIKKYIA